eukprot:gb/GECH01009763.1/.p1 GENE.gb/GECH01009763.1/~~gb/GECH01009763.1/.p1  ORF type:complete len:131 (+),score=10.60 gb/GECH01009763.1/:1-393(+)
MLDLVVNIYTQQSTLLLFYFLFSIKLQLIRFLHHLSSNITKHPSLLPLISRPNGVSRMDILKVMLSLCSLTASFCMMLVAMSFNVGLFCAVVLGATTGWTAVFWHGIIGGGGDARGLSGKENYHPLLMHQ